MQSPGIETTFQALAESRNSTVGTVLRAAFASDQYEIRLAALRSLLRLSRQPLLTELVEQWHEFTDEFQALILEQPRNVISAVRKGLSTPNRHILDNAIEIAHAIVEPVLVPDLLRLAEPSNSALRLLASKAILATAHAFADAKASRGSLSRNQRLSIRKQLVDCLQKAVIRFEEHQCDEILEAFLVLADCRNARLKYILQSPREAAMRATVRLITESVEPTIMNDILVELLTVPDTSPMIVKTWSQRSDRVFVEEFCRKIGRFPNQIVRGNLARMKSVRWLKGPLRMLNDLSREAQAGAMQIVKHCRLDACDKFRVIQHVLLEGEIDGKQRAAELLREVEGPAADRLVARFVDHEDPTIQASLLGELRRRKIAGAMDRLMTALDSPHAIVRNAAKRCFPDIDFDRFMATYDGMDADAQRVSGALVLKVDPDVPRKLEAELKSASRNRRIRALHVSDTLNLLDAVETSIQSILDDEDFFVRASAATLLGKCRSSSSRGALRNALMDPSRAVREAAEKSLQAMSQLPGRGDPMKN